MKKKRIYKSRYKPWAERIKRHREIIEKERRVGAERQTLYKYGLTLADKMAMLEQQGFQCANTGCGRPLLHPFSKIPIDHCHKTGAVRGLLCQNCNVALGLVRDRVACLTGLIQYLTTHRAINEKKN